MTAVDEYIRGSTAGKEVTSERVIGRSTNGYKLPINKFWLKMRRFLSITVIRFCNSSLNGNSRGRK